MSRGISGGTQGFALDAGLFDARDLKRATAPVAPFVRVCVEVRTRRVRNVRTRRVQGQEAEKETDF
jgi:hypothetical protein